MTNTRITHQELTCTLISSLRVTEELAHEYLDRRNHRKLMDSISACERLEDIICLRLEAEENLWP